MIINDIVNNETTTGNQTLRDLSDIMPEYKDYRLGSKSMYTPNDVKKALKTLQHYVSFGGNLLDGVQTTT